ncbi:hypothetical protein CDL12_10940 [Handroanthus impetiginosus]|uniref:DUF4216 domain-containing protein n=1 Tax=Handroanthus impetiginosus TaxID=429701 RepID=A0A2G9HG56_9LAMI|nr:hypothetical protein CDL12_10940 [Handroanthus impetiginosus]
MVNGYRFHTRDYGQQKATMNSGVCCRGSLYGDNEMDDYGVIEEILELAYVGQGNNVFIFRYCWFDPVYYTKYPSSRVKGSGDWWAACKVRAKLLDVETLGDEVRSDSQTGDYYQEVESSQILNSSIAHDEDVQLRDENAQMTEILINEIHIPLDFQSIELLVREREDSDDDNDSFIDEDNIDELELDSETE